MWVPGATTVAPFAWVKSVSIQKVVMLITTSGSGPPICEAPDWPQGQSTCRTPGVRGVGVRVAEFTAIGDDASASAVNRAHAVDDAFVGQVWG